MSELTATEAERAEARAERDAWDNAHWAENPHDFVYVRPVWPDVEPANWNFTKVEKRRDGAHLRTRFRRGRR